MNNMEILSPAGSMEAVEAAVQSGASAIYLGYGDFNARRKAKNFTFQELEEAIHYCHLREVQVFFTLNTILRDRELPKVEELLRQVLPLGLDAVIVQDLAALSLLQQLAPTVAIHGSTQCAIHSLEGVLQAEKLGFSRVVLARELSHKELSYIAKHSPLELEVFVHGALCMSYSGQCYLSAVIGERSGNRGLCAQPCRQSYSWDGGKHCAHPLSLKDMSLGDHLQELQAMGIASLKIEGRMKRAEYVAIVTKIYRQALSEGRKPTAEEWQMLELAFSRQGFTQGYYQDQLGRTMFGVRESGSSPKELYAQAKAEYHGKECSTVPLDFHLYVGDSLSLVVEDAKGNQATVYLPEVEEARQKPLTEETAIAQLQRTGGTVYKMNAVTVEIAPNRAVPLGKLNQLRRDVLEEITALRSPKGTVELLEVNYPPVPQKQSPRPLQWTLSLSQEAQLSTDLLDCKPSLLYLPYDFPESAVKRCQDRGIPLCVKIPSILSDQERTKIRPKLAQWLTWGVTEALVGTLDSLHYGQSLGFGLRGDMGLNLSNGLSVETVEKHYDFLSLMPSFELQLAQIRDMRQKSPLELFAYGHIPLMTMKNSIIPEGSGKTLGKSHLTDRKQLQFPVEEKDFGRSYLYNALPLYLADKDLDTWGLTYGRLSFSSESPEDCVKIYHSYQDKSTADFPMTRGLYYRGVD